MWSDGPQFNKIVKQLNNVFDDTDEYLSAELKFIINHRSSNSVLEFQVEYTHGDKQHHPIDLIKDNDPHATANYIIKNDLGIICKMIYGR